MTSPLFIVPGFHGSGPAHWQTWTAERRPQASRLNGVDWEFPDLTAWADRACEQLAALDRPAWLLAHSFGSLVSVAAAARLPEAIAGVLLVAPADPRRFHAEGGLRERASGLLAPGLSVAEILPRALPAGVPGLVLASENDPWLSLPDAERLATGWGAALLNLGRVGHINVDSGFGPWPALLHALDFLERDDRFDAGRLASLLAHGRGSASILPLPTTSAPVARKRETNLRFAR